MTVLISLLILTPVPVLVWFLLIDFSPHMGSIILPLYIHHEFLLDYRHHHGYFCVFRNILELYSGMQLSYLETV